MRPRSCTVLFKDVASLRAGDWRTKEAYTYGLHGTPTTFTLEARLAAIEGGTHCVLAPSGLAAISMILLALLRAGDDVLLPDNVYNPTRELGRWLATDFGVSARFYDPLVGAGIADLIQPNTKLIWTEAPGSVSMEVPDLPAICAAAKAHGILVALDNTWAAGLALRGFDVGADIVMQALTKYQSGGSDVLMGAAITRDQAVGDRIATSHMRLGMGVGADDAYLVLRGLETIKLRFDAHDASARKVAAWLKGRPEIAKVLHPAFEDCPGHDVWRRDFTGAGPLRRRAGTVRHRVQLGRDAQSRRAVPDAGHAAQLARHGPARALQHRSRRDRRSHRRHRAGARGALITPASRGCCSGRGTRG
jgi:cysteine-S-conjugate beta-lyase